jgi:hypothetical protein
MRRSFLSNFIARISEGGWRGLTGPHALMLKERPDVCAPMAANLTGKPRLKVRQADVIAPAAGVDHDGMRALIVGAIDDEPGGAGLPHFSEGDLLFALHFPRWRLQLREAKQRKRAGAVAASNPRHRAILCRQASIRS